MKKIFSQIINSNFLNVIIKAISFIFIILISTPIFAGPKEDLIGYYFFDPIASKKEIEKAYSKLPKEQIKFIVEKNLSEMELTVIQFTDKERIKTIGTNVEKHKYEILKESKKSLTIKYNGNTFEALNEGNKLTLKRPEGNLYFVKVTENDAQTRIVKMNEEKLAQVTSNITEEEITKIKQTLIGYYEIDIPETMKSCEELFVMVPETERAKAKSDFEESLKNSISQFTDKEFLSYTSQKEEKYIYEIIRKDGDIFTVKYGGMLFEIKVEDQKLTLNSLDLTNSQTTKLAKTFTPKMKFVSVKLNEEKAIEKIAKIKEIRDANPPVFWKYDTFEDKMRNAKTYSATVASVNKLNFKFPYNGGSSGYLSLAVGRGFGASLTISKGQFLCDSNSTINVKFDDDKIETFSISQPSDGSTNIVFITPYKDFASKIAKSKRLIIEAGFYQEGSRQLEFNVNGLVGFQEK